MQKRAVQQIARDAGVGLDGVRVKINRQVDMINRQYAGHTSPDGTITLYPDAFASVEQLVRTLGHERMHVMQVRLHGEASSVDQLQAWEAAARSAEEQFVAHYNRRRHNG